MSKSDAEEGELSGNSDIEVQPYEALERPLLRPTRSFTQQRTVTEIYSDNSSESEESSSDEDLPSAKRRKFRNHIPNITEQNRPAAAKKNVWSSVILEEHLEEEIKDFGVVKGIKHFDQTRSVESYNYKPGSPDSSNQESGSENEAREVLRKLDRKDGSQSLNREKKPKSKEENFEQSLEETKKLLQKRKRKMGDRQNRPKHHLKPKFTRVEHLDLTAEASEIDLAQDIAAKLHEHKFDLILRTIQILGKETAVQLFEETREAENDGGILTADGSRRRTPGGVFLHLLRNHERIPMEKIREVFREENRMKEQIRRAFRAKRRQGNAELSKQAQSGLPELPSRADLALRETGRQNETPNDEIVDVIFEDDIFAQ